MEGSTMKRDEIVTWFGESTVADAEALIGKSFEEFTADDLQRVLDTLHGEIGAAEPRSGPGSREETSHEQAAGVDREVSE
jgi:hypothetical protein